MKRFFVLFWAISLLGVVQCGTPAVVHSIDERNTPENPLFSAHRGLQPFGPENSFASFKAAMKENMWAIETDFRMTADSVVVCMHDATLDRTTNGTGKVRDMSWRQLCRLQIQEVNSSNTMTRRYEYASLTARQKRIPTMEDYFRICRRGGCIPFIELKEDDGVIARMNAAIEKYGFKGRCIVSSTRLELLKAYRASGGTERIHLIFAKKEDIPELLELGNAGLAFNYKDLDSNMDELKELVDYCHSLGLKICFRAVDTPEAARKSLFLGIDYMPTNNLWRLP